MIVSENSTSNDQAAMAQRLSPTIELRDSALPATSASSQISAYPRIWVIQSDKVGDNAQLRVIADALPWPYEIKHITVRAPYVLGKPTVRASLHHVDLAASDDLSPPWPDLIITCGRRMSMVALWIQEQSARLNAARVKDSQSGAPHKTKVVLLGMPRRGARSFDLAVVSRQYRPRQQANALQIDYPLQRIDEAAVTQEADKWREHFDELLRPRIAVMVGGPTRTLRLDAEIAAQFARDLTELQLREGGSLIVLTSRRTPLAVVGALERHLPAGSVLHQWKPDGGANPYRALLGLAERFVVTGDSVSMLMEIACLGRPLAIYPLPGVARMGEGVLGRLMGGLMSLSSAQHLAQLIAKGIGKLGFTSQHRDIGMIHRQLLQDGLASRFGEAFRLDGRRPKDELPIVVGRIVALLQ